MRRRISLRSVKKVTDTVIAYVYTFDHYKRGEIEQGKEWEKKLNERLVSLSDNEKLAFETCNVLDNIDKDVILFLSKEIKVGR